jgi:RNA polymerase sigma factor (sigma-70 family)
VPRDAPLTFVKPACAQGDDDAPPESGVRAARSLPDAALLSALGAGDLAPLGELYARHARGVRRAVTRAYPGLSAEDAEDVVQAAFLKLPAIATSFDGRASSSAAWLRGVGLRVALHHRRATARRTRAAGRLAHHDAATAPDDPEARASARQELGHTDRALAALSAIHRSVIVLLAVEGLTPSEIATRLVVPPATVRTRLCGARKILRAAVERRRA